MTTSRHGILKLWLLDFAGNAVLLAAGYFWLLIPDAGGWQVGGSLLLAAAIVFLALWLPAGTLAYFRIAELREHATVWPAYRRALRHLLPFAIWMIALVVVVLVLTKLRIYPPQFGVWFRQKMPGSLRGGMSPRSVMHAADWLLWFLLWVVLPAFWLPVASTVAATWLPAASTSRCLSASTQTAPLLDCARSNVADWRLPASAADPLDPGCRHFGHTGMEHGPTFLCSLHPLRQRMDRARLGRRPAHRGRGLRRCHACQPRPRLTASRIARQSHRHFLAPPDVP